MGARRRMNGSSARATTVNWGDEHDMQGPLTKKRAFLRSDVRDPDVHPGRIYGKNEFESWLARSFVGIVLAHGCRDTWKRAFLHAACARRIQSLHRARLQASVIGFL